MSAMDNHQSSPMKVLTLSPPPSQTTVGAYQWCLTFIKEHEETLRRVAILALLYLYPVLRILHPVVIDPDIWWHLRTGQWMVEHGALPTTDPFSAYGEGKPWVPYSWLFEILIYGLFQELGYMGIILYTLFGSWAVIIAIHWLVAKREPRFVVAAGVMALSVLAIAKDFTPRPWLFTIMFFTVTFEAVLSLREGHTPKRLWLLPLMYALWANLHIQFIYGLAVLGLACAAPLIDRRMMGQEPLRDHPLAPGSPTWWKLVGLTTACLAATLMTPHHVRLYGVIAELAAQKGMYEYTQELWANSFRHPGDWAMLALAFLGWASLGRRSTRSSFEIILLVAAGYFAFRSQRDVWFLAIAASAILATDPFRKEPVQAFVLTRGRLVLLSASILLGLVLTLAYRGFSEKRIQAETAKFYPIAAAAFVEERGYPGPLYNPFDWGGYLIWRLPQLPVALDGRANVHGDERIERSFATWTGRKDWSSDRELASARIVIGIRDTALTSILQLDSRFELVFEDSTASVFVRRPDAQAEPVSLPGAINQGGTVGTESSHTVTSAQLSLSTAPTTE